MYIYCIDHLNSKAISNELKKKKNLKRFQKLFGKTIHRTYNNIIFVEKCELTSLVVLFKKTNISKTQTENKIWRKFKLYSLVALKL